MHDTYLLTLVPVQLFACKDLSPCFVLLSYNVL